MKTIAFVSQKGGAGKSTLAANIAALAASKGQRVAIIDLDQQASISAWHSLRETGDIELIPSHPPLVGSQVAKFAKQGFDLCVIDTAPHNSTGAANAIAASDYTVIPVRPSAFDLVAGQATFDLLAANGGRGGVVLNAVPASSNVASEAADFVSGSGFKLLGEIAQRIAFQHAVNSGHGVIEYEPSGTATKEINQLWETIEGEL